MLFPLVSLMGAFALFLLEPWLGKALTPRFGGGAQIWGVCLVFFQGMLLAGYAYAHLLQRLRSRRTQAVIHGLLWIAALATLATGFAALRHLPPEPPQNPAFALLMLLARTAALPLLAIAATSPLIQTWARHERRPAPYRLYAWSNAGSFAGLLAFPFLLEPWMGSAAQAWVVFALASGTGALSFLIGARPGMDAAELETPLEMPLRLRTSLGWVAASAAGTALLVAVTTKLSAAIASVPLLWIAPLAVYLLSFVLVFDGRHGWGRGRWPAVWIILFALCLLAAVRITSANGTLRWRHIASGLGMVFAGCMACHAWLYERRPGPGRLTEFYLCIAGGGALGGLAVALVAPLVFDRLYEFGFCALAVAAVAGVAAFRQRGWFRALGLAGAVAAGALGLVAVREQATLPGIVARNFYGFISVDRYGSLVLLTNLKTTHGLIDLDRPREPLAYYGPNSGAGRILRMEMLRKPSLSVGVLGLGLGSLADYERASDDYTFYEINPLITDMVGSSTSPFQTLRGAPGRISVVEGDGRLALEREARAGAPKPYDVLVLDAFSGDAVPWHLLTREAFQVYLDRLSPDGILLLHVSNPLPVDRIALGQARSLGLNGACLVDPGSAWPEKKLKSSFYLAFSRDGRPFDDPLIREATLLRFGPSLGEQDLAFLRRDRPWTDDRNSLSDLITKTPAFVEIQASQRARLAKNTGGPFLP